MKQSRFYFLLLVMMSAFSNALIAHDIQSDLEKTKNTKARPYHFENDFANTNPYAFEPFSDFPATPFPMMISTGDLDVAMQKQIEEDMRIMARLLGNAVDQTEMTPLHLNVNTHFRNRTHQNLFIHGTGAMFFLNVEFPLAASPKKERLSNKSSGDAAWDQAREKIYGSSLFHNQLDRLNIDPEMKKEAEKMMKFAAEQYGMHHRDNSKKRYGEFDPDDLKRYGRYDLDDLKMPYGYDGAMFDPDWKRRRDRREAYQIESSYNSEDVQRLIRNLATALRSAANMRALKSSDTIWVILTGSAMLGIAEEPAVLYIDPRTQLTLAVKKKDIDDFHKGKLRTGEFLDRIARHAQSSTNHKSRRH